MSDLDTLIVEEKKAMKIFTMMVLMMKLMTMVVIMLMVKMFIMVVSMMMVLIIRMTLMIIFRRREPKVSTKCWLVSVRENKLCPVFKLSGYHCH